MPKLISDLPETPGLGPAGVASAPSSGLDLSGLQILEERQIVPPAPVIDGAAVVYLGADRNPSIPMRGRLNVSRFETAPGEFQTIKSVSDEGFYNYAFESHDALGNMIYQAIVGGKAPPDLQGRPWKRCEHPEHLRLFMRRKNRAQQAEFKVLVPPAKQAEFMNYVIMKERAIVREMAELKEFQTQD